MYSGTSPYGHLTSKKTSPLQSPWLSPKLYSTVEITPCNKVTSPLRSLLPSPVGDLNSEVPLYVRFYLTTGIIAIFINSLYCIAACQHYRNNVIITGCLLLREIAFNKFPLLLLLLFSIYFYFYCFLNIIHISLCITLIMVFFNDKIDQC